MRATSKRTEKAFESETDLARRSARQRFSGVSNDGGRPSGIVDPENPPLSDEDLLALRPAAEMHPGLVATRLRRKAGRPKSEVTKQAVSLRLDLDVIDALKTRGAGWQSQANALLRIALGLAVR